MTILAAYVPTAEGRAVLDRAVAEAQLRDTTLIIARHVPPDQPSSMALPSAEGERQRGLDMSLGKIREDLDAIEEEVKAQGVRCGTLLLTGGKDAAQELLKVAAESDVGLIVVGVRRRSPVGKAFLGSDAQDILLQADCPVLAVKAD